jgi:hypothetical protein
MSRQALGKPIPDLESFKQQVRTWTLKRNAEHTKINWQFKTQDARIKLARVCLKTHCSILSAPL